MKTDAKYHIRTTHTNIYGLGNHEIYLEGADGVKETVLTSTNCSRTFMEPIVDCLNNILNIAYSQGYDHGVSDTKPKPRKRKTK